MRSAALLLALLVMALLFAGCGGSQPDPEPYVDCSAKHDREFCIKAVPACSTYSAKDPQCQAIK